LPDLLFPESRQGEKKKKAKLVKVSHLATYHDKPNAGLKRSWHKPVSIPIGEGAKGAREDRRHLLKVI
jgi:hypothetical protein